MRIFLLHLCFLNEHKCIFLNFLLWDNYRFTCSCKKEYKEIFFVSFSQLPSMVTSCKTIVQDHNQDFDTDSVKI